jgi:hypothetical protein
MSRAIPLLPTRLWVACYRVTFKKMTDWHGHHSCVSEQKSDEGCCWHGDELPLSFKRWELDFEMLQIFYRHQPNVYGVVQSGSDVVSLAAGILFSTFQGQTHDPRGITQEIPD